MVIVGTIKGERYKHCGQAAANTMPGIIQEDDIAAMQGHSEIFTV